PHHPSPLSLHDALPISPPASDRYLSIPRPTTPTRPPPTRVSYCEARPHCEIASRACATPTRIPTPQTMLASTPGSSRLGKARRLDRKSTRLNSSHVSIS